MVNATDESEYSGILAIGDPHLEGRQPGFRKDDYPQVVLAKIDWCLHYAREHKLLPVILGDLFDKPRDNPNWMVDALLKNLHGTILGIYGNHDVHYQPELTEHDTLSLLVSAGRIQLVSTEEPWCGIMNGRPVVIGGSSYRQEIPESFDVSSCFDKSGDELDVEPFVLWMTHHDILIPGYDEGRIKPRKIPGINVIVNGHIHRELETITKGKTKWMTPGNISRRSRSDATREHVPHALRFDIDAKECAHCNVTIPHGSFDEVFHEAVTGAVEEEPGASAFVAGLSELQSRKTSTGAGLKEFLDQNIDQFEKKVVNEIWKLAEEILDE